MKQYIFKSERLGFREWTEDDTDPFIALNSDSDVMEYFESIRTQKETLDLLIKIKNHHQRFGFCLYAVEFLEESKFIGFIGFMPDSMGLDISPCIEIGWRLDKAYWNRGLATEGAKRCLEYAFNLLKIKEIYSCTALINKRSERIMQKIGMNFVKNFNHPNVTSGHKLMQHVLYHIQR